MAIKLTDLSILEVRILKHLYCQNPNRDYSDPAEIFKHEHGLAMTAVIGIKLRLFMVGVRRGSDLSRRINPGTCIPGGTLNFIHSQLKAPKILPDSRVMMPENYKRSFHDAVRSLVRQGMVHGFVAGYEIAEGEDGFRAPLPAPWQVDGDADKIIGVTLTSEGFKAARELFLQLAEEGD